MDKKPLEELMQRSLDDPESLTAIEQMICKNYEEWDNAAGGLEALAELQFLREIAEAAKPFVLAENYIPSQSTVRSYAVRISRRECQALLNALNQYQRLLTEAH